VIAGVIAVIDPDPRIEIEIIVIEEAQKIDLVIEITNGAAKDETIREIEIMIAIADSSGFLTYTRMFEWQKGQKLRM